jgi:hypothetical protein
MRTRCHNMSPRKTLTGTFWWTATWSPNIDLKIWKQVQQNPSKCPCTQFFSCTRQHQKFHDSQFYHRGAAKKRKLSQLMIPYLVHSTPKCSPNMVSEKPPNPPPPLTPPPVNGLPACGLPSHAPPAVACSYASCPT